MQTFCRQSDSELQTAKVSVLLDVGACADILYPVTISPFVCLKTYRELQIFKADTVVVEVLPVGAKLCAKVS